MFKIKACAVFILLGLGTYYAPTIGDKVREFEYRVISKVNDLRSNVANFIAPDTSNIHAIVRKEASLQGVRYELVEALIHVESGWNVNALNVGNGNGSRDYGLMQVNSTHIGGTLCPESKTWIDLMNPTVNVRCGIRILKTSIDSTKTTAEALTKYNCGRINCPQGEQHAAKVIARLVSNMNKSEG